MQKPFAFYFFAFIVIMAFATSCHFNPDMQTQGAGYLQGDWRQDSVAGQKKLVSYSLYQLKFSCDSFYIAIHSYNNVNTGADSCTGSGHWTEYCKGTYEQRHDTLHVKGLFCNADMTIKNEGGCFRSGDYEEYFKLTKKTDSLIQFASTSSVIPINAHLIKRTSCVPKPL